MEASSSSSISSSAVESGGDAAGSSSSSSSPAPTAGGMDAAEGIPEWLASLGHLLMGKAARQLGALQPLQLAAVLDMVRCCCVLPVPAGCSSMLVAFDD